MAILVNQKGRTSNRYPLLKVERKECLYFIIRRKKEEKFGVFFTFSQSKDILRLHVSINKK